jgi:enolase
MKIKKIVGREILDSRGNPTVEADVILDNGTFGRAAAPSGASVGSGEALELRDGGKRFNGLGVRKAVANVRKISALLRGMDPAEQQKIDERLIQAAGEGKKKLGANATVAVSLAVCAAAAYAQGKPIYQYLDPNARRLPVPMLNVINGGKHAGNSLSIQEFMLIPKKFKSFREALRAGAETYKTLGQLLEKKYGRTARNIGDEGGYAPPMRTTEEALNILTEAIEETGYDKQIFLGLDCAASSFHDLGHYRIDGRMVSATDLLRSYEDFVKRYPIISIEDPFNESDFPSLTEATRRLRIQVVGDDYFVSDVRHLKKGVVAKAGNALILKVNQIGTLTEALRTNEYAKKNEWNVIVSHRSGETEDTFIADLAVGIGCGQIKTGAPARGERTAKYNQLLRIEEELGNKAKFG